MKLFKQTSFGIQDQVSQAFLLVDLFKYILPDLTCYYNILYHDKNLAGDYILVKYNLKNVSCFVRAQAVQLNRIIVAPREPVKVNNSRIWEAIQF